MVTICSVCHVETSNDGNNDGLVSHGLCEEHYKESIAEIERLERIENQKGILVDTFLAIRPEF